MKNPLWCSFTVKKKSSFSFNGWQADAAAGGSFKIAAFFFIFSPIAKCSTYNRKTPVSVGKGSGGVE